MTPKPHFAFCLALASIACGKSHSESTSPGNKVTHTQLSEADRLGLTDATCQAQSASLAVTQDPVSQVYYGEAIHQLTRSSQSARENSISQDAELTHEAQTLKKCGENPDTLDAVATTTLGQIEAASQYYSTLDADLGQKAKGAILNLHPLYELQTIITLTGNDGIPHSDDASGFVTDNASWSFNGSQSIFTVYPQSKKGKVAQRAAVWTFPAVLAHEFGHKVFFDNFPTVFEDSQNNFAASILKNPFGTLQQEADFQSFAKRFSLSLSGSEAPLASAMTALNEGTADLYAFAATGMKPNAIDLACFRGTRDLASGQLANGSDKILTKDVLQSFVAGSSAKSSLDACSDTSEVHIFGPRPKTISRPHKSTSSYLFAPIC